MQQNFALHCHHSHENLHIAMEGVFTPAAAHALLGMVRQQYRTGSRIFVDTTSISAVEPAGGAVLRADWAAQNIPSALLFFKGQQGFQLGPDGSRVLLKRAKTSATTSASATHRHKSKGKCCGKCAHCTCGGGCGSK